MQYLDTAMSALQAFVDNSGSGGDSEWFVLAGYLASASQWDAFNTEWQRALDLQPQIRYFKSSEAESLKRQFGGFTREQSRSKIDLLIKVIQKNIELALSVRVRQKNYDEIIKSNVPPEWDNAYYFLFPAFIAAATSIEKYFGSGSSIEFIFDSQEQFEKPSRKLYQQMLEMRHFAGRVSDVIYRDEKKELPLQAADLVAWQTRRFVCVPTEPRRSHFDECRRCAQSPYTYVISRPDLHEMMEAINREANRFALRNNIPVDIPLWEYRRRVRRILRGKASKAEVLPER